MATRRQHFQEAARLAGECKEGIRDLSDRLERMTAPEVAVAVDMLRLTADLAQVYATLATAMPAASPEG